MDYGQPHGLVYFPPGLMAGGGATAKEKERRCIVLIMTWCSWTARSCRPSAGKEKLMRTLTISTMTPDWFTSASIRQTDWWKSPLLMSRSCEQPGNVTARVRTARDR